MVVLYDEDRDGQRSVTGAGLSHIAKGTAVVFRADQEIGRDLAAVDWASTPLAPADGRPQSLIILTDNGTWKTPRKGVAGAGRGRGIVLMQGPRRTSRLTPATPVLPFT